MTSTFGDLLMNKARKVKMMLGALILCSANANSQDLQALQND